MNHHLKQFNRMFRVGATWKHESRVAGASTSSNIPPPPKFAVRKDHKPVQVGQEISGPPVRPIVAANHAPNSRFSNFLSRIVNDFVDCEDSKPECRSSEEMRSAFEQFNMLNKDVRMKCKVISMDVKALYPSMMWKDIVVAVK
jgi:hypothetical protein